MKNAILNILLIFLSKKTRIKLMRKLDLLESLSGKRCVWCKVFLYDIAFGRNFCPECGKKEGKKWVEYNVNRQEREKIREAKEIEALKNKYNIDPIKDIARGR